MTWSRGVRSFRGRIASRLRNAAHRFVPCPAPYQFLPAPSIVKQTIEFRFLAAPLVVEAPYHMPLYETVAEVVDYDCYQLRPLARALEGATVIDIGANVGVTALCLSRIPGIRLYCFEPDPDNCRQLRSNLALNSVQHATVIEAAVAAESGTLQFWRPEHERVGGRLLAGQPPGSGQTLEVRALNLDEALALTEGPVGLVKIDCEGGEYAILEQLTPALAARISRLTLEVHQRGEEQCLATLAARLRGRGYALSTRPDPFGRTGLDHLLAERSVATEGARA